MNTYYNEAVIAGKVISIEKISDTNGVGNYYRFMLEVSRLSQNKDILPVIVSEKLLVHEDIKQDAFVCISGSIRTKNYKNHLHVFCYTEDICKVDDAANLEKSNYVSLKGTICKTPNNRTVKSGRIITDLIVACNKPSGINKSYYIPCITWGPNAKSACKLRVGDKINILGRFQSRKYYKKTETGVEEHTAYEVSVTDYGIINEEDKKEKE